MITPYQPDTKGPLEGIRVLDMTRLAAGNMMTHMLADFGADVIKIERPGKGDDLRYFGAGGTWWKVYARSKKSLTLNIRSDEGKALLLKLVETADVLVENFVPGTLEKWGLSPEKLWQHQENLVIARISGWGQTGPYAHKPGFGTLIEGMSGFASMTGWEDRDPLLPPLALADMVSGMTGFGGTLAALLAIKSGQAKGQVVDLSLFEPLFGILGPWAATYQVTGEVPKRQGNRSDVAAPRNVYPCKDGKHLAMSASMQSMWEKLAQAINRPDLLDDPRFATPGARIDNAEVLDEIISAVMATRTLEENLNYYEQAGVTVGPICDISDLMNHEYVRGRGVLQDFADVDMGQVSMHNVFPRLSETPGAVRAPAPSLGQHNREILSELGFSTAQQSELVDQGVI
ncbi:CaiB/BaiF CoA-transferase family protein [Marinomonas sp. 15G1-11]|uniref:CaiB/BaiF CoA-transferase family protein n=1 Tax=Marinomonas phaeophyticola TaxID=3004091 RepID=A0ABT4JW95_9GAMM|nr:CaiB/BaiF CoA-transferase family protein [Marinomonas sp. 15G1-11]MCZ2722649.1 CaiB/BaiF CoA-transferase family protein [Marinomonas sp. 15G1-11]